MGLKIVNYKNFFLKFLFIFLFGCSGKKKQQELEQKLHELSPILKEENFIVDDKVDIQINDLDEFEEIDISMKDLDIDEYNKIEEEEIKQNAIKTQENNVLHKMIIKDNFKLFYKNNFYNLNQHHKKILDIIVQKVKNNSLLIKVISRASASEDLNISEKRLQNVLEYIVLVKKIPSDNVHSYDEGNVSSYEETNNQESTTNNQVVEIIIQAKSDLSQQYAQNNIDKI